MRFGSNAPLLALGVALVTASAAVSGLAPRGLLPNPERPFAQHGTYEVRVESDHSCQGHARTVAEIRRILHEHLDAVAAAEAGTRR